MAAAFPDTDLLALEHELAEAERAHVAAVNARDEHWQRNNFVHDPALEKAEAAAADKVETIRKAIERARPATVAGCAAKLRLLRWYLDTLFCEEEAALAASIVADLERITRQPQEKAA